LNAQLFAPQDQVEEDLKTLTSEKTGKLVWKTEHEESAETEHTCEPHHRLPHQGKGVMKKTA